MIYPVYAIRDQKVAFSPEFIVQSNDQAAVRGFGFMINNARSLMGYSPGDYDLFHVADFDDESGQLVSKSPIEFVVNGGSVFNEKS